MHPINIDYAIIYCILHSMLTNHEDLVHGLPGFSSATGNRSRGPVLRRRLKRLFPEPVVRRPRLACLAMILWGLIIPGAAHGSLVVSNFTQGYSLNSGDGGGGGANPLLPPINYKEGITNGPISVWVTQTVSYDGPTSIGLPTTNLFSLSLTTTAGALGGGSASSSFTMKFTLDYGDNFTYTRTTPPGRGSDVKLLFEGRIGNSEIAPGTGVLGAGNYIVQVEAANTAGDSLFLQIGSTPVPEPACLPILAVGMLFILRRRRP
jgi:hypothetical protein